MFFSVIIPNLNSPILRKTLDSLLLQEFDQLEYEMIVVGVDKYNSISPNDPIFFDETTSPISPAIARNRGARQAAGDILIFIDSDCIADNNLLNVYYSNFLSKGVDIIGGGVRFEIDNYWQLADNISTFHQYHITNSPGIRDQLPSLNLAIKKEAFWKVNGFDERYPKPSGEDSDLTIRLRKAGYILYFEPNAIVEHHPERTKLISILKHGYSQGKYSCKVDPRHRKSDGLPWPIYNRLFILLFSPFLAFFGSIYILIQHKDFWRFWYTFPIIVLNKFLWCIGASTRPWH